MQHTQGALAGTATVVQALCDLPAVPTMDWCDRAARCLCALATPSRAVVLVTGYALHGVVTEAVGAAGVPEDGAIAEIRRRCEAVPPVALLGPGSEAAMAAACDAGQDWFDPVLVSAALSPDGTGRVLTAALAAGPGVANDRCLVRNMLIAVAPALIGRARQALGGPDPPAWLTEREQQVLSRLVRGLSVREIAGALGRSPHTVHDRVKTLHKKLRASTRGALIARALGCPELPEPLIPQTRRPREPTPDAPSAPAPGGPPGAGPA